MFNLLNILKFRHTHTTFIEAFLSRTQVYSLPVPSSGTPVPGQHYSLTLAQQTANLCDIFTAATSTTKSPFTSPFGSSLKSVSMMVSKFFQPSAASYFSFVPMGTRIKLMFYPYTSFLLYFAPTINCFLCFGAKMCHRMRFSQ